MSDELKYSDNDVKARVEELVESKINELDKEGIIGELKESNETLKAEKLILETEKAEAENTLTELTEKFETFVSPEDVDSKIAEALTDAEAKAKILNSRVEELTEAGVVVDDELESKLDTMDDEAYALLVKVVGAKVTESTKEDPDDEIATPIKASETSDEDLPNSGGDTDETTKTPVERASELMRKIIRGE